MIIDIIRRPKKCPRCGGEVCDILYGEPTATWEEVYLAETGHRAVLGGCIISENMPDYECAKCELQLRKLSFPRHAKRLAENVAAENEWAAGVEYVGIYHRKLTYRLKVKEGYCCDGFVLIFVDQKGKTTQKVGIDIMSIIDKITFRK